MIRRYEVAAASNGPFGGYIYAEFQNNGTCDVKIYEIRCTVEDSSNGQPSNSIGIGRGTSLGTPTTSVTPTPIDPNDPASGCILVSAWGGDAGFPSVYLKKAFVPATNGEGYPFVWTDDAPLVVKPGGNICVMDFNGAAGGNALSVAISFSES